MFAVIFFFRELIFADRPGKIAKIAKIRTCKNFMPEGTAQFTPLPDSKPGQNNTTTNT